MRWTNKLNLPDALYQAISRDPYSNEGAWRSVTQLIAPPRLVYLRKQHDADIEEDISDGLYMLYGQLVHHLLERANVLDMVEKRLFLTVKGKLISGAFDSMRIEADGFNRLSDWKFSTAWKAVGESEEWLTQMNFLRHLLMHGFWDKQCTKPVGMKVDALEVVLLMRDHSKPRARRDSNYPQLPIARLQFECWTKEKTEEILHQKIQTHIDAETSLPLCSSSEMWEREAVYAVRKIGRKSAVKLFDDEKKAITYMRSFNSTLYYLMKRKQERVRCESYCMVAPFCSQFKKYEMHSMRSE